MASTKDKSFVRKTTVLCYVF